MIKDTVITAKQKRRELLIFLICIAGAVLFNLTGIIMFSTPAKEMLTQLHIVLLVAVFFYMIQAFFRIIYWLVVRIFHRVR